LGYQYEVLLAEVWAEIGAVVGAVVLGKGRPALTNEFLHLQKERVYVKLSRAYQQNRGQFTA
jgi:hypothetical protein